MIKKIDTFFLSCSNFKLIIYSLLTTISLSIIISFLIVILGGDESSVVFEYEKETTTFFITLVLIAPLIETLFFQTIPFYILNKVIKNKHSIVLITGLIFGLAHYANEQNIIEVVVVSIIGIIYSYVYYISIKRVKSNPYLMVTLIHGGYNLFIFIVKTISVL